MRTGPGRSLSGGRCFGEGTCGGRDEAALGEHRERPGALPDEVRRGLEPGADADATAREQRDGRRVDVPGDRLGRVARVLVLGQDAEERPAAGLDECREDERERRLGDARRGREIVRERAEGLALGEGRDEAVER